jgi:hypothetical protein
MKSSEIYILEDNLAVRQQLSAVLAKADYYTICFADGEDAYCARPATIPALYGP